MPRLVPGVEPFGGNMGQSLANRVGDLLRRLHHVGCDVDRADENVLSLQKFRSPINSIGTRELRHSSESPSRGPLRNTYCLSQVDFVPGSPAGRSGFDEIAAKPLPPTRDSPYRRRREMSRAA